MVSRAVSFSSISSTRTGAGKRELWQPRTTLVCLCWCAGHPVRRLRCWYIAQNLKDLLCETGGRTERFTISFGYRSLRLYSFHQTSEPQILLGKNIVRVFSQPSNPSACISIGNAGWLAAITHGVQQQEDCFPPLLPKTPTFSLGPCWVFHHVGDFNPYGAAALPFSRSGNRHDWACWPSIVF